MNRNEQQPLTRVMGVSALGNSRVASGAIGFTDRPVSIGECFELRVAQHGHRLAVKEGRRRLTYAELDRAANRVANAVARAAASDAPGRVALLMEDPIQQLIAMLGTLKSGCAYVPMDVAQPNDWLAFLLGDAEPGAIVTDGRNRQRARGLAGSRVSCIDVDALDPRLPDRRPGVSVSLDALAYILYTSGSTGEPKGVMQTHRNVLHYTERYAGIFRISPEDRLTWLSGYEFAASASNIFGALLTGAALLPYRIKEAGLARLPSWLIEERITFYHSIPTVFRRLCATIPRGTRFPDLRLVRLGGEAVRADDVELFRKHFGGHCALVHSLSMTEINGVRHHFVDIAASAGEKVIPVGYPVEGIDVEILDDQGEPLEAGGIGEIAVRSRYLTPGYWRRPDLTAQTFVLDPSDESLRLFKTGDLGRLRPDACLEHLGRKDFQIKLRGVRIEPAEIEAALVRTGAVREATVTVSGEEDGEPRLVAFVVWADAAPDVGRVRSRLAAVLPDYMIPAEFVGLDALPSLATGKVDRLALSTLRAPRPPDQAAPHPPRDLVELRLTTIWEKGFGFSAIEPDEDFFALGGHSLLAAQLFGEIYLTFGVNLPLATLVQAPTIEKVAEIIRRGAPPDAWSPLIPLNASGTRPPVYVVPGGGSDVLSWLDLARRLGPDQPVYGFQPAGVDGGRQYHRSVEAIAAHFVRHLQAFQAQGPYFLVGGSFGGLVAFEMARQLAAAGHEVAFLGVLDTNIRDYPRKVAHPTLRQRAQYLIRWFLPFGQKDALTWTNLRRGLQERWDRIRADVDLMIPLRGARPSHAKRFLYLQEVSFRARRRYVPGPYPGKVVLLRCESQPPATLFEPDPELGWHGLAAGGLEIHEIPGAHGGQIMQLHVRTTAQKLGECLRHAQERRG